MLKNHFTNAPSVGSHDSKASYEELQARIDQLERERERARRASYQETPKKTRWGKIGKFFQQVVVPVLVFIPAVITALATYNRSARAW